MPIQVGLIASLQGKATATNTAGKETALSINSPIFEGDLITPDSGGEAIVETNNNEKIVIQGGTPAIINALPSDSYAPETALEQIQTLQETILSDEEFDFSELEATAAGETNNSGHPAAPVIEFSENTAAPDVVSESRNFDTPGSNAEQEVSLIDESSLVNLAQLNTNSESLFLGDAFINVTEDFLLSLEGGVNAEVEFTPDTISTEFGELTYNEQGEWRYTLDNNRDEIQQLGAGDTLNESIELSANNGKLFLIEVTINGSNDQAILTGTTTGVLVEDGFSNSSNNIVSLTGQLDVQDRDANEASFAVESAISTTYGTAEIDAQGQWRYELNNELNPVQGLSAGQILNDSFSVNSLDGTSQLIQITIEGSNDAPILRGSNFAAIDLGSDIDASGSLSIEDPDFGQSHFQSNANIDGLYGVGSIDESGQWAYQINSENPTISSLGEGERVFDTFMVLTADGTQSEIIIKIDGSDTQIASTAQAPIIELSAFDQLLAFSETSPDNLGANVYIWNLESETGGAAPTSENISHFVAGDGGDILQLNDLLVDSQEEDSLEQFLHFSYDGNDTTLEIRPDGPEGQESHLIILNDIDLTSFGNSDSEIIHQLINNGNLDIAGL